MCEQNDEMYDKFYTEEQDDIYGDLTPIEDCRFPAPVNFANMTLPELIQETHYPRGIGSCCTATAILLNTPEIRTIDNQNIVNGNINYYNINNQNINYQNIDDYNIDYQIRTDNIYEEIISRILNNRN